MARKNRIAVEQLGDAQTAVQPDPIETLAIEGLSSTDHAVVDVEAASTPVGWTEIEAGHEVEPDVVAHVPADVADAFGMTTLVSSGLVVVEGGAEIEATPVDATVEQHDEPAAPVAVADTLLRLPGLHVVAAARDLAAFYAGRIGSPIELVSAAGVLIETMYPRAGRAAGRASADGNNANLQRALRHLSSGGSGQSAEPAQVVDWGVWNDADLESSPQNAGILNLKHRIEDAFNAGDMDALLAFNFKGSKVEDEKSASTYYKRAGKFLRAKIATLETVMVEREAKRAAEQAALDAEFGFDQPGVLIQAAA
jgi:hypothetical protein